MVPTADPGRALQGTRKNIGSGEVAPHFARGEEGGSGYLPSASVAKGIQKLDSLAKGGDTQPLERAQKLGSSEERGQQYSTSVARVATTLRGFPVCGGKIAEKLAETMGILKILINATPKQM